MNNNAIFNLLSIYWHNTQLGSKLSTTYNILSVGMFEFMIKYILSQIILHVLHLPKLNWFIIHFNNYFWLYQVCDAFILEKEKLFYSEKKQAGSVTLFTNRSSFQSASQLASVVERNLIFTLSVGLFFPKMAATKELSALTL